MQRITWLAAADARGHLVRAHVMRELLEPYDVRVEIFTTSQTGVEFLEDFGSPAELLDGAFRVEFDRRQNLDVTATARRVFEYLADPDQFWSDFGTLRRAAARSALVVNDFHPALLVGGFLRPDDLSVVHLHGSNLWRAIARPLRRRAGRWVNPLYERLLRRLRRAGVARVVHKPMARFEARWPSADEVVLPPLVPPVDSVRRHPEWRDDRPHIAVYLNPHFRDPTVARSIEATAGHLDAHLHAVGEGFADRPHWRACDPEFPARAAEADLLISAPGMGAVGLCRTFRTPLLMVRTDQPEQQRNARRLLEADGVPPCGSIDLQRDSLHRNLPRRAANLVETERTAASRLDDVHGAWSGAFCSLLRRRASGRRSAA